MSKRSSFVCLLCLVLSACASSAPVLPVAGAASGRSAPAEVAAPSQIAEPAGALVLAAPANAADASWIGAAAASEYLLARSSQHEVGVWIEAPQDAVRAHVATMLVLAIDTSGSMEGEKMDNARRAARSLIENLHEGDIVSIETFADTVTLRAPPTRIDAGARARLSSLVSELSPNGGTNLFAGVKSAEQRAQQAPASHPVRRVIVISDGRATVGVTSAPAIGALADLGTPHGVQVSALGVGLDYDESALNALAERSNGRLFHIGNASELAGVMEREIALLNQTIATQAFVEFVPAPGVRLLHVQGGENRRGVRGSIIVPIGALYTGQSRELIVKLEASQATEGLHALVSARLVFNDPQRGGLERVQEQVVSAHFTHDPALSLGRANSRVSEIVARQGASELARSAARQASAGDLTAADHELEKAEQKLRIGWASASGEQKERLAQDVKRVVDARGKAKAAASAPAAARPQAARKGSLEINDLGMDMAGY